MHSFGRYLNSAADLSETDASWFGSAAASDALGELGGVGTQQRRRSVICNGNAWRITTSLSISAPLSGDMDISVFSKYISDMKRVYPAVEGRITFSGSTALAGSGLGFLLLALFLSAAP